MIGAPRSSSVPLLARLNTRAHVRTQQKTLRRFVLLAPQDTVDSVRVAESLRRLRRLSYLDDVLLVANDCGPAAPVRVTLLARDAMSFRPDLRFNTGHAANPATGAATASPASYSAGFQERNLLGTGRELSAAAIGTSGRNGYAVAGGDPTVFGSLYAARGRLARNPIENATAFALRPPDRELSETWRGELGVSDTRRSGPATRGASFARRTGQGLVGRRLTPDDGRGFGVFLMLGAEAERTRLAAAPDALLGGPATVRRDFAGADVGVARYAEQYDALTWLLPDARVVDVPRGFEGELVTGLGRDAAIGRRTAHVDLWAGRMWLPRADRLLVADVWNTGYVRQGYSRAGASTRAALTGVAQRTGGYVYARLAAERLAAPDPDQQALLGFDPTVRILATRTRLAQTAVAGLLERDWRVTSRGGRMAADLAGCGAFSYRASARVPSVAPAGPPAGALDNSVSGAPSPDVDQLSTAVGVGARLVPNALGRSAIRVDYVVPVSHGPGGRRKPYLAASVAPWIVFDRFRDGRRGR